MKKLFAIILFILFTVSVSWAGEAIISSGASTSDRAITTKPAYYYGCVLLSSASTGTIVVYDSLTIEAGKEIFKASVGLVEITRIGMFTNPVECFTGIYCDITGTGANYIIYYKVK